MPWSHGVLAHGGSPLPRSIRSVCRWPLAIAAGVCPLAACTSVPVQLYQGMEPVTGAWVALWAVTFAAVAGFLVALWRAPRWLARFPLRDVVLAACTFGLAFVAISLPYRAAVVVAASALGPFIFLIEGAFYKGLLFLVLGAFFAAVPRPGVYLLFYLLWMVAQVVSTGYYAYGPVTLLFAGVAVTSMEAALWVGGVTRAGGRRGPLWQGGSRRGAVLWPSVAICLGEFVIVYWDMLLFRSLYRLHLPQWLLLLQSGTAALYAAAGAAAGLRMGYLLLPIRRLPLPEPGTAALPPPPPVAGAPLLELSALTFAYPPTGQAALRDISLAVQPGEITLIAGATGCGKTTLLRLIQGLLPLEDPHAVRWQGVPRAAFNPRAWAQRCALLFQEPAVQMVGTSPADEMALGLRLAGRPADPPAVAAELERHGVAALAQRPLGGLSGGEVQQLVLGALLAGGPRLLLLDEPLAQLDAAAREALPQRLAALAREGMAVLVAEHRTAPLLPFAQRVVWLERGAIAWQGTPQAFQAWRSRARVPAAVPAHDPAAEPAAGGSDLRLHDAGFHHPRVRDPLLAGVTARLAPGEAALLHGPNGAGKSTLLELVLGLRRPTGGAVTLGGRKVHRMGWAARSRAFGYLPQRADLLLHARTVEEELAAALRWRGTAPAECAARVASWLERLELVHAAGRFPHLLSRGERQRLALGAVLIGEPRLLVLDEPFAGLDPDQVARVLALCRDHLAAQAGRSLLVATHDVDLAGEPLPVRWHLEAGRLTVTRAAAGGMPRLRIGGAS